MRNPKKEIKLADGTNTTFDGGNPEISRNKIMFNINDIFELNKIKWDEETSNVEKKSKSIVLNINSSININIANLNSEQINLTINVS